MNNVIVIGGGPAGLMSAISASKLNKNVILFEKNEKIGKKLYITGKWRCNLTNDTDIQGFISNIATNPKFIYGAINSFSPSDTISFFNDNGLQLKTERGKRVFPLSDKSSDVIKTLNKVCQENSIDIKLNSNVDEILIKDGKVCGVKSDGKEYFADSVIVCTGGISYPLTGSTGDGYKFAVNSGHNIISPKPALVGIELSGYFFEEVQGLSLKNVKLTAKFNDKKVYEEMGEMLFTHFGISGPIVLSCSSVINKYPTDKILLELDLKPALSNEVLDDRIIREFKSFGVKNLSNALMTLLPKSLISVIANKAGLNCQKKCCEITVEERNRLVKTLKCFSMKVKSLRPVEEAIVTSGGIDVKDVNPKTMESKIIKGLYFAGEVLDVDAFTGGFNIQTAFSTGYLAGLNA